MRGLLFAGLACFAVIFAAGFAPGTMRVLVLLPRLSESLAVLLELPLMLALSWVVAGWPIRRCAVSAAAARAGVGALAFGRLMAAAAALSLWLFGRDPAAHLAHYATLPAALGLAGQLGFALMPLLHPR